MNDIISFKGKYYIRCGSKIPPWQSGFNSIECAKEFLSSHDNIESETRPVSADDIAWILENYNFLPTSTEGVYYLDSSDEDVYLTVDGETLSLHVVNEDGEFYLSDVSKIVQYIDDISESPVLSCILARTADREAVTAAIKSRPTDTLVRVKSSNLWATGIDVKKAGDNKGDMYIQFKGKNGGPENIYIYYDVPVRLYRQFIAAPSKGHFFWAYIRDNFQYRKLTGDKKTHLKNGL